MVSLDRISIKKKVTSDFNMSVHSYKRHIYITWQMVRFGSGHSGCGLEWAILNGLKMGWVRRVELTHIFHKQKKKKKKQKQKKCQFFKRE